MNTEQVLVTVLVDLEYETQNGRDYLIHCLKSAVDIDLAGGGGSGYYKMKSVPSGITVSSNDESTIRAAEVKWNLQADQYNQWDMLGGDEKKELIEKQKAANIKNQAHPKNRRLTGIG